VSARARWRLSCGGVEAAEMAWRACERAECHCVTLIYCRELAQTFGPWDSVGRENGCTKIFSLSRSDERYDTHNGRFLWSFILSTGTNLGNGSRADAWTRLSGKCNYFFFRLASLVSSLTPIAIPEREPTKIFSCLHVSYFMRLEIPDA